jgi:type I restriction-modification system DNA methylase subunit
MAKSSSSGNRDLETALWATADKLRGTLDAAEYKHVVLGLIFLKYISDSFEDRRAELQRLSRDKDTDYYVKDEAQREQVLELHDKGHRRYIWTLKRHFPNTGQFEFEIVGEREPPRIVADSAATVEMNVLDELFF